MVYIWKFHIVQCQLLSPSTSLLFLLIYVSWKEPRMVVYASGQSIEWEHSISSVINNQVSSMSSQWKGCISHEWTPTEVLPGLLWNNAQKVSWPDWKVPFCGKLNLWHTLGITAQHTLDTCRPHEQIQLLDLHTFIMIQHAHYSSKMYSLYSWYKLPSTLTTYHTAYLFSFTLYPHWYVAYSRSRISAYAGEVYTSAWLWEFPCAIFNMT